MPRGLSKSMMSKVERELEQLSMSTEPIIWLQTAAGEIVKLDFELGPHSPMICDELDSGVGFARSNPIYLSRGVAKDALEMIFDYFRFYEAPGRSSKDTPTLCKLLCAAKCLKHEELIKLICRALALNVQNSSQVKQDLFKAFEKCVMGEELEPQKFTDSDLRTRLSNKLLAKQKKELQVVENVKKVEVQSHEDRTIDDLMSFINGGDGDTRGVQTSKKKKKNRNKGKEKKKTSSCSTFSSTEASVSKKVFEDREDINASNSAKPSVSTADTVELFGTRDETFDIEGDVVDDDSDPTLLEDIDRMIEAISRRRNLDRSKIFRLHME